MNLDNLVRAVIDYLKSKNQLEFLPQVAEKLTQAGLTAIDPNLATITSVVVLDIKQKRLLKNNLSKIFDRPVRLKTLVDPGLLAGLRISLDGKVIDTSLNNQLSRLNESLVYD